MRDQEAADGWLPSLLPPDLKSGAFSRGFCYAALMVRFVFWNVNRADIPKAVVHLAYQENADVLILAECAMHLGQLLMRLNVEEPHYQLVPGNCDHLVFFTRFESEWLTPLFESHRISIRRLVMPPPRKPILIAAAHLPSKQNYSDESQVFESVHLARLIEETEEQEGHQRTVVIGDLNMNPFESGMVAASGGLHAVTSRRVATRAPCSSSPISSSITRCPQSSGRGGTQSLGHLQDPRRQPTRP